MNALVLLLGALLSLALITLLLMWSRLRTTTTIVHSGPFVRKGDLIVVGERAYKVIAIDENNSSVTIRAEDK